MARPPQDDIYHEFFKAKHMTQYLEKYIDQHRFGGLSLREKILFSFNVLTVSKFDNKWVVSGENEKKEAKIFHASKLIVASGLTSIPIMPVLPGKENFERPIIHQQDFGHSSIISSTAIQNITVIGGAKSAADMVYASVKAGKSVSWLIRTPGTGPGFFVSPKGKGPYKNAYEMGSTRFAGTFTPSVFSSSNWWTRFLHESYYGRKILHSFWSLVDSQIRDEANFDGRHAKKGFRKLSPHTP